MAAFAGEGLTLPAGSWRRCHVGGLVLKGSELIRCGHGRNGNSENNGDSKSSPTLLFQRRETSGAGRGGTTFQGRHGLKADRTTSPFGKGGLRGILLLPCRNANGLIRDIGRSKPGDLGPFPALNMRITFRFRYFRAV